MKWSISSDIKEAFHFGSRSRGNNRFTTFMTKVILMMIPALIMGHYLDQFVAYLQHIEKFGSRVWVYVAIQSFLNIFIIFELYQFFEKYADEFQTTSAGLFFGALFWSVQTTYVANVQKLLGTLDKSVSWTTI